MQVNQLKYFILDIQIGSFLYEQSGKFYIKINIQSIE